MSLTSELSDDHRQKLLKHRSNLVEIISIDSILIYLLLDDVLTKDDVINIHSKKESARVELFLDILVKKSEESYWKFIDVLRSRCHEHVAKLLEPVLAITGTVVLMMEIKLSASYFFNLEIPSMFDPIEIVYIVFQITTIFSIFIILDGFKSSNADCINLLLNMFIARSIALHKFLSC